MLKVFSSSLLTDPKSRKVIVVENPLLPLHVKDAIARILFNNLQVPSISFASSHLLSLVAAGRVTGLVLDCGNLESTALPVSGPHLLMLIHFLYALCRYSPQGHSSRNYEPLPLLAPDSLITFVPSYSSLVPTYLRLHPSVVWPTSQPQHVQLEFH